MTYYTFRASLHYGPEETIVIRAKDYVMALNVLYFGRDMPIIDKASVIGTSAKCPKNYDRKHIVSK